MANVVPYAFPVELLSANHNFASDTFKLALYTSTPYTTASTVYDATNETTGTEYSAGGIHSLVMQFQMLQTMQQLILLIVFGEALHQQVLVQLTARFIIHQHPINWLLS